MSKLYQKIKTPTIKLLQVNANKKFKGSKKYWEQRYIKGGNSGSGSYGRLAEFKAEVLNDFVKVNDVRSVIELGCGDGNQLLLANYPSYVGVDVSVLAVNICKDMFNEDNKKKFYLYDEAIRLKQKYDLSLSLDVIYHLVEDLVFEDYMRYLFSSSNKFVIIYSSDDDELTDPASHVRHRKFSEWVRNNVSDTWSLSKVVNNKFPWQIDEQKETSFANFYIYKKV
jgi:protein O-GlcNAc transferase